jgi:hypothetical protein
MERFACAFAGAAFGALMGVIAGWFILMNL